jgi:hypothetical protein
VKLMPHDTSVKRDYRRQHARTAMQALLDKKFLFLRGADRISATNAVQATTEEFDEKAKA